MRKLLKYIFVILFIINYAYSDEVNISKIYIDSNNLTIKEVLQKKLFKDYNDDSINLGITKKTLYFQIEVENVEETQKEKVIIFTNTRLGSVQLYNDELFEIGNNSFDSQVPRTIFTYFPVKLNSPKNIFYIRVNTKYSEVNFFVKIKDKEEYLKNSKSEEDKIYFLSIVLIVFIFIGILLWFVAREISYLFYAIYLGAFLLHQTWYTGYSKIHFFSEELWQIHSMSLTFQITLMITTFTLFAISFLQLEEYPRIKKTYVWFVSSFWVVTLLTYLFFDSYADIMFYIILVMATVHIIFSNFVGYYLFFRKNIDAKYFIAGYGFVSLSFLIEISDAMGITTLIYHFPHITLMMTCFEAFIILVAFFAKYKLMKKENDDSRQKLDDIDKGIDSIKNDLLILLDEDLTFCLKTLELKKNKKLIRLRKQEKNLLKLFCQKRGEIVYKEEIEHTIWDEKPISDGTLRSLISKLRKKLDSNDLERFIVTSHGSGYKFQY